MKMFICSFYFQEIYEYTSEDLIDLGEIGKGNFGSVNQMLHRQSQTKMAVKVGARLTKLGWVAN